METIMDGKCMQCTQPTEPELSATQCTVEQKKNQLRFRAQFLLVGYHFQTSVRLRIIKLNHCPSELICIQDTITVVSFYSGCVGGTSCDASERRWDLGRSREAEEVTESTLRVRGHWCRHESCLCDWGSCSQWRQWEVRLGGLFETRGQVHQKM